MSRTPAPTCGRGHPWAPATTYVNPRTGQRVCRVCKRLREAAGGTPLGRCVDCGHACLGGRERCTDCARRAEPPPPPRPSVPCPACGGARTTSTGHSRERPERRYRRCEACGHRFAAVDGRPVPPLKPARSPVLEVALAAIPAAAPVRPPLPAAGRVTLRERLRARHGLATDEEYLAQLNAEEAP